MAGFAEPAPVEFPLGPVLAPPGTAASSFALYALHGADSPLARLAQRPVGKVYITAAVGERYHADAAALLGSLADHHTWLLGDERACEEGIAETCVVLERWHAAYKYAALATAVQLGARAVWLDADSALLAEVEADGEGVFVGTQLGELSPFAVLAQGGGDVARLLRACRPRSSHPGAFGTSTIILNLS